eukprot:6173192-Pleurochrysis_carterae.AAC.2
MAANGAHGAANQYQSVTLGTTHTPACAGTICPTTCISLSQTFTHLPVSVYHQYFTSHMTVSGQRRRWQTPLAHSLLAHIPDASERMRLHRRSVAQLNLQQWYRLSL